MVNKAIITTIEASKVLHKDCRLVYLTPGVKTPKLAYQSLHWKLAETPSILKIQLSYTTTATQGVFFLTFYGPKYPWEVRERR